MTPNKNDSRADLEAKKGQATEAIVKASTGRDKAWYSDAIKPFTDALKTNKIAWEQPWEVTASALHDQNPLTGSVYKGGNSILLEIDRYIRNLKDPRWTTYIEAEKLGFKPRPKADKDDRIHAVIYKWDTFEVDKKANGRVVIDNDTQQPVKEKKFYLKKYVIYNYEDLVDKDGKKMSEAYPLPAEEPRKPLFELVDEFEAVVAKTGAEIRHGGNSAYYSPKSDHIQMPNKEQFNDLARYYGVKFHELGHWTGAPHRLNRDKRYNQKEGRAKEELVAEMTAYFTCRQLGVPNLKMENHVSYVQSWLRVLDDDPKFFFTACDLAQKACDFIVNAPAYKAEVDARKSFEKNPALKRDYKKNFGNKSSYKSGVRNELTGSELTRNI